MGVSVPRRGLMSFLPDHFRRDQAKDHFKGFSPPKGIDVISTGPRRQYGWRTVAPVSVPRRGLMSFLHLQRLRVARVLRLCFSPPKGIDVISTCTRVCLQVRVRSCFSPPKGIDVISTEAVKTTTDVTAVSVPRRGLMSFLLKVRRPV